MVSTYNYTFSREGRDGMVFNNSGEAVLKESVLKYGQDRLPKNFESYHQDVLYAETRENIFVLGLVSPNVGLRLPYYKGKGTVEVRTIFEEDLKEKIFKFISFRLKKSEYDELKPIQFFSPALNQ